MRTPIGRDERDLRCWRDGEHHYPVALYLQDAHPIREGIEYVRQAEAAGFSAVWQADSRLVRDAVVPMAAFAAATERIKVGSGVIDIWTRNAARLASTFSTLDDLAPGRILCGLGAWWDPLASKVGIERARPLTVMREVIAALRGLLGNQQVSIEGTRVRLDGVELDYVYQERRPKDVPIYIGATGMQMMELAGEIADGVVLNYLVDPAYNVQAMEALTRGAAKAGRSVDDVDRPQLVVCSVDADRQAALDAARLMVTQYLGQQPHIMKASGVPQELLDEIATVLTWPATHEQVAAASRLVPDDVVQRCTASGSPDEVVAKVDEYVANGCTCPILYPLGPDVGLMIETFARPRLTVRAGGNLQVTAMIEIDRVTKRFGGVLAVDDLSLTVEEGEVVVLLGSSGCGKTTTLRMINRLVEPTSGTIRIGGRDVSTMPRHELAARRRLRDPAERAVPASHRHRQRDDGAPPARLGQAAAQRPGQRAARGRRPRRVAGEEVSGAALRRPAAARRRRPRPRRRPAGVADGRAVRRRRSDRAGPTAT